MRGKCGKRATASPSWHTFNHSISIWRHPLGTHSPCGDGKTYPASTSLPPWPPSQALAPEPCANACLGGRPRFLGPGAAPAPSVLGRLLNLPCSAAPASLAGATESECTAGANELPSAGGGHMWAAWHQSRAPRAVPGPPTAQPSIGSHKQPTGSDGSCEQSQAAGKQQQVVEQAVACWHWHSQAPGSGACKPPSSACVLRGRGCHNPHTTEHAAGTNELGSAVDTHCLLA